MSPLTARQERLARRYGGWMLARIIADPDIGISAAKSSQWGASGFVVDGVEWCMQTTPKGVELRKNFVDPAAEFLPWPALRRHVLALPQHVRDAVRDADRACGRHQAAYPTWKASAAAQGCGRGPAIRPLSAAQQMYADERQAWHADRYLPWLAEQRRLDADRERALDLCFPPRAVNDEPSDLLELLALTEETAA